MRVLLDHCIPKRFGRLLQEHEVSTTFEMGWASLSNGVLLRKARESFEVFLTVDQNVQFQQNLSALPLAVVILAAPDNRFATLEPYAASVLQVLGEALACEMIRVESPGIVIHLARDEIEV